MQIVQYTEAYQDAWDAFVNASKNGTFLHSRAFLAYHGNRWKDASVLIMEEDVVKAVFPACEVEGSIVSHQGSSTGGLVVGEKNKLEESMHYFELLTTHYAAFKEIRFKKHEYIFDRFPSQEVEFAALHKGFSMNHVELSTCIKLDDYEISINRQDKIKRASKKLQITTDDRRYEAYHQMLTANLASKHEVTPTHSLEEMHYLKEKFPDHFHLVSAYHENQLVAGIWTIRVTKDVVHIFYVAQDYHFKHLYATSLLVNQIIEQAKKEGCTYLNFGVSTENLGEVVNVGLYNFKESFGGHGISRSVFVKKNPS